MPQRILIAGGTGFIGAHLVRSMIGAGHSVVTLARGGRDAPDGAEERIADRRDPAALARALEGDRFDITLDFSAYDDRDVKLLLALPGFEPGRYVLASTGQVCLVGMGPSMPYREEDAVYPLRPQPPPGSSDDRQWTYGAGKRAAEAAVYAARERDGLSALVLRLPVILGDGDTSLRTWAYLERMLDGAPLLVPDGGRQPVRFMWVGDVVRAVRRALERWPLPEAVYHLAQPDIVPLVEVLRRMALAAGRQPELVSISRGKLAPAGLGLDCSPYSGPWVSLLDPARAVRDWGFEAMPLDEYLPEVVRAHLDRPPRASHAGYTRRQQEIALVEQLKVAGA